MNDVIIEVPTVADIDQLCKWGNENWELWYDAQSEHKWFSKKYMQNWIKNPKDDVLLVARKNGVLVGMCLTYVVHNWALCSELFVDLAYRGQGVGSLLLSKLEETVRPHGIETIQLFVNTHNHPAHGFYKKFGFTGRNKFLVMHKKIT